MMVDQDSADAGDSAGMAGDGHSREPGYRVRATMAEVGAGAAGDPAAGREIAVLIPCYNEALTIGTVVRDFARALPTARIYVYDNNSKDATAQVAREAGALVRFEPRQGKGHVVRRMFRDIEADLYILVDGDDTYDAGVAPMMVATALAGPFDLANGCRVEPAKAKSYRRGHRVGNQMLTGLVLRLFGNRTVDMLSGYKVLSRRFVKSFPVLSDGFEIETELTVHALELSMPITHVETTYRGRPEGSSSKLRTFRDGWRILRMTIVLFKQERPLLFFALLGAFFALASVVLATPVIIEFFQTHLVPRLPTAVLATGLMMLAFLCAACGLILDTVTRGRLEAKLLSYLTVPQADRVEHAVAWLQAQAASAASASSLAAGLAAGAEPRRDARRRRARRRAGVIVALAALAIAIGSAVATALATGIIQFP
jgi:hypothetical protein